MIEVPADTPLTIPVDPTTVATAGVTELHVPPATASVSDVDPPIHKTAAPVIVPALTDGFTVTTRLVLTVPQLFDTV